MCSHYFIYEPQGQRESLGTCKYCGNQRLGLNGFPDELFQRVLPPTTFQKNVRRVIDNDVERILNDKRYPHIFNRNYDCKSY
jgi:hypothetical protein